MDFNILIQFIYNYVPFLDYTKYTLELLIYIEDKVYLVERGQYCT